MRLERLELFRFPVPFKVVFRHASAARRSAENLIVAAHSACGRVGYGEGCPRRYVTGEDVAGAAAFVRRMAPSLLAAVGDLDSLRAWIARQGAAIDANPAAFAAVELALLDLIGRVEGLPLERLLGLPPLHGAFRYTAVLGDLPYPAFLWQRWRYRRAGFRDFKLKLSGRLARDRRRLRRLDRPRVDANNLWTRADDAIAHLAGASLAALEEPLAVGDLDGCRQVAAALGTRIVLDESLVRLEQLDLLRDRERWIVSVRVSKMGGVLRSLAVTQAAAERGLPVIVGAQVGETGLLTRAALPVMQAAGANLLASEGAFGTHLLSEDLTTESLRFGRGGLLQVAAWPALQAPGLGLAVRREALLAV